MNKYGKWALVFLAALFLFSGTSQWVDAIPAWLTVAIGFAFVVLVIGFALGFCFCAFWQGWNSQELPTEAEINEAEPELELAVAPRPDWAMNQAKKKRKEIPFTVVDCTRFHPTRPFKYG